LDNKQAQNRDNKTTQVFRSHSQKKRQSKATHKAPPRSEENTLFKIFFLHTSGSVQHSRISRRQTYYDKTRST